jgi:hypothetical protein
LLFEVLLKNITDADDGEDGNVEDPASLSISLKGF